MYVRREISACLQLNRRIARKLNDILGSMAINMKQSWPSGVSLIGLRKAGYYYYSLAEMA